MKKISTISKGLIVLLAAGAALGVFTPQAAKASSCNTKSCSIWTGHMYLLNNWWGVGSGVSGWQDIWLNSANNWGTDWSWSGGTSWSVKTYAEMVDGWNWSGFNGAPFPKQINSNSAANTWWYFTNTNSGTQDVSWDCFFSWSNNPGSSNPSSELMIWLQSNGGAGPLGSYKKTVSVDNASWNVYQGYGSWNVVSYVRTSNTNGASINVMDFCQNGVTNGWFSTWEYLLNIDTGTEIFSGHGSLSTSSFGAP